MFGLDTRVLRIVYTVAACYLVYVLRDVLLLLLLSVVAAYLLLPFVDGAFRFLTGRRHRRSALVIVFVGIVVVLLAVGSVIGYYVFGEISSLAQQLPSLMVPGSIQHIKLPRILRPWDPQIRLLIQNWEETDGRHLVEAMTSITLKLVTALGGVLSLLVILVLSFLLLKDGESYVHSFLRLVPTRYEQAARAFLRDMHKMMQRWTRAIVMGALGTVFLYGVAFGLLGVPDFLLLAMVGFPFEFVPLIGPPIGFAIIMLVAYFGGYQHLLWMVVVFFAVRLIQDFVLQPLLMSKGGVELPAYVVIFGALAGEAIWGMPGLLLSIPAIATIRLLYRHLAKVQAETVMQS